jgi:hypothetical protein
VEVNPSNFVAFGVGALNHKVTLAVSTPREPNALAKAVGNPELRVGQGTPKRWF